MKKYMSVKEMGDLLGIKKTDRYWLLKKGYFKVVTIAGKMWVDTASFEDWYAHQVKYRKNTGERSENEIRELSYSPKEAAALLGVSEWLIYELIKSRHLKTIKVDGWTRILKDDFYAWYAKQDRYQIIERKGEIRKKQPEEGASVKSIPVEEVAVLLGISNHEMHRVSEEYPDLLEEGLLYGKGTGSLFPQTEQVSLSSGERQDRREKGRGTLPDYPAGLLDSTGHQAYHHFLVLPGEDPSDPFRESSKDPSVRTGKMA